MTMQMPSGGTEGRVSGQRYDRWVERGKDLYLRFKTSGVSLLLQDGYPPGGEPASPQDQRVQLTAWKIAGDPRYHSNPRAQDALTALEQQAGMHIPLAPPPLEGV